MFENEKFKAIFKYTQVTKKRLLANGGTGKLISLSDQKANEGK